MCYNILGEDDYDLISSFESPEQVIDSVKELEVRYAKSPIMRMLTSLQPHLNRLQTFVTFLFLGLGAQNMSAACIWGAATLLIEVLQNHHLPRTGLKLTADHTQHIVGEPFGAIHARSHGLAQRAWSATCPL